MQKIDDKLIDRAMQYCRKSFKTEEEFRAFWYDNYVWYCEAFARGDLKKCKN